MGSIIDFSLWNKTFRNWPTAPKGWRNWFHTVSDRRADLWEQLEVQQCLTLTLSEMEKNECLLVAASYFWSNTANAFMFGHGSYDYHLS